MHKRNFSLLTLLFFCNALNAEVQNRASITYASPQGIYLLFHAFGCITDIFFTRGDVSEKHQKMFNDIARKLGIENRGLQVKNMGLISRLATSYNNAFASPTTNRVYVNEDVLNQLSDGEKQFLMAHELTHHRNHHIWKNWIITTITLAVLENILQGKVDANKPNKNLLEKYCDKDNSVFLLGAFSIHKLVQGQISQMFETEADTEAITVAGLDPEDGVKLFDFLENPDTTNWPLYAKMQNFVGHYMHKLYSLPIINLHMSHPPIHERQEHLRSLKRKLAALEIEA